MNGIDIVFVRGAADVCREGANRIRVWVTPGEPLASVIHRLDYFCKSEGLPYTFGATDDSLFVPSTKDHHEADLQVRLHEERLADIDNSAKLYKGKLSGAEYIDWRSRWDRAREVCVAGLLVARHIRDDLRRRDELRHLKRRVEGLEAQNRQLKDEMGLRTARAARDGAAQRLSARAPAVLDAELSSVSLGDGGGRDERPAESGPNLG